MEQPRRLRIGLLINELDGMYQAGILSGLRAAAQEQDVQLLCFPGNELATDNSFWRGEANIAFELARRVALDGILSVTASFAWTVPPEQIERFFARLGDIPVVSIGKASGDIPVIKPDNARGMGELVDHFLLHHGCRRIAFIAGPEHNEDAIERLATFRACHANAGVPLDESLILPGTFFQIAGRAAIARLLASGRLPEAIIAANDQMAFAAIAALTEHGLQVPEDIAVGGFDDLAATLNDGPPLSSVRQETAGQAELALRMLVERLRNGEAAPAQTRVATRAILRRSCGCSALSAHADLGALWEAPAQAEHELELLRAALRDELSGAAGVLIEALSAAASRARATRGGGALWRHGSAGNPRRDLLEAASSVGRSPHAVPLPFQDLHNMLRVLHRECAQLPPPAVAGTLGADALLFEAQAWLSDHERMGNANEVLERAFPAWMLSSILLTRLPSRDFNLSGMLAFLREGLLSLQVRNAYLVLFPRLGSMHSWDACDLPEEGQLVLAIRDGDAMSTADFERFPTAELLPMPVFHQDGAALYGILPIFQQHEHYGYLIVDVSRRYSVHLEQLRESISNLVTSTMVVGELDRARELLRRDLDRAHTSNEQLIALAEHDELTRLLNRRGFFARAVRGDNSDGAVLISADMDGLKMINDTWGHAAGDAALRALAAALRASFRAEDLIARFGGDEFAVLSRGNTSPQALAAVRERLAARIATFNREGGQPWTLSASLGIVSVPPEARGLDGYMEIADQQLYDEKRRRKTLDRSASN
ncbi:GGDEF domain-containing protein [Niveibacterium sp. SC-1]|uniref:GGDEF domain-containing protein n=1 Tax=Niveibacterium sp. SC-1 TaxID=3135646 RepID=UPI00311DF7B3